MSAKNIFIILAVITIAGIGILFIFPNKSNHLDSAKNSSSFFLGGNAIYVTDQIAGEVIRIALVRLEKPGFIAIHQDENGIPGEIIGVSSLIQAGETTNIPPISLSRETREDEVIYAMLHFDDGNGLFNVDKDRPVMDLSASLEESLEKQNLVSDKQVGEPIMMIINIISKDVIEPDAINL